MVAASRRIDEAEQALFAMCVVGILQGTGVIAVLRADIDGRTARQTRACENIVEFGAIVAREKHIVPRQRKAVGARRQCPGDSRERARTALHGLR